MCDCICENEKGEARGKGDVGAEDLPPLTTCGYADSEEGTLKPGSGEVFADTGRDLNAEGGSNGCD